MIFIFWNLENPKGWMVKVETRGLISKVGYKTAHESHNTQHLSLASLSSLLFAMDYVYLFFPLSQNSYILKILKRRENRNTHPK